MARRGGGACVGRGGLASIRARAAECALRALPSLQLRMPHPVPSEGMGICVHAQRPLPLPLPVGSTVPRLAPNAQPPPSPTPSRQIPIILLTNDAANRAAAVAEGLPALGVAAYCRKYRADAKELQVRSEGAHEAMMANAVGWRGRGGGGRGPVESRRCTEELQVRKGMMRPRLMEWGGGGGVGVGPPHCGASRADAKELQAQYSWGRDSWRRPQGACHV